MAVAVEPDAFAIAEVEPGWRWQAGPFTWDRNPKGMLDDGAYDMIRLWRLYQGGGMGAGYLPDAGGTMDQAAVMIGAFAVMSRVEAQIKPREG